MVGSQKQVRIGNRTLSRDESSAVQTLTYATAGNIPAVRSKDPRAFAADRVPTILDLTILYMQSS
jgi:hypothetical protein